MLSRIASSLMTGGVGASPASCAARKAVHGFPKFDTAVPDLYRYEIWKRDFEQNGPANLSMFWPSSDHTGGPPSPAAQVADNDLAVGKIVDLISHSKYWKDSAIFVVDDDSQAGLDHVDGHRAPIQIISPWAQHGAVDNHYYSQITMIRTIEQILGIHPMNQKRGQPDVRSVHQEARQHTVHRAPQPNLADRGSVDPAFLRCGHPRATGPRGCARAVDNGAGERAAGCGAVAGVAEAPAPDRAERRARLRQPRADEPLHVVPDARVDAALPE
jgi:hypothetical protein